MGNEAIKKEQGSKNEPVLKLTQSALDEIINQAVNRALSQARPSGDNVSVHHMDRMKEAREFFLKKHQKPKIVKTWNETTVNGKIVKCQRTELGTIYRTFERLAG